MSMIKDETLVTHPPTVTVDVENPPVVFPIYQSAKFCVQDANVLQNMKQDWFLYSRYSNPTVRQLELLLSQMQGTEDGIAVASGVAAITSTLLSLLKAGDHVLMFLESYKPCRGIAKQFLARFGITSSIYSINQKEEWQAELKSGKPRLVLFESPTNPITRVHDVERLTKLAKDNGVITVFDNTFAGFHNHHGLSVDIYLHSLTKFAGGHGDVLGGAILASKDWISRIRAQTIDMGPTLDPHAAGLILRGMKTYFLRYRKHCENAVQVASFLSEQEGIERVLYPGLKSHPDHDIAKDQLRDFGGIIAFDLAKGASNVEAFLNRLQIFKVAVSIGSTDSLACPVWLYVSDLTPDQKKLAGVTDRSVRLSVGIEDPADLIQDLSQALRG